MFDIDNEDTEEVDILELRVSDMPVGLAGIARKSGTVYLNSEIHPLGGFAALMIAAKANVPYISTSAVNALFPSDWLKAECLHDPDRLRLIDNAEAFVRMQ